MYAFLLADQAPHHAQGQHRRVAINDEVVQYEAGLLSADAEAASRAVAPVREVLAVRWLPVCAAR
jgi:hypothetical protein